MGLIGFAVGALSLPCISMAANDGKPPEKLPEPADAEKPASDAPAATVTATTDGSAPPAAVDPLQQRLDYVNQLREAIQRELVPTPEQTTKLNEVFDRHVEKLTKIVSDLRQLRESNAAEIESLRKELDDARQAGDADRYRSLMGRMQELRGRDDSLIKPVLLLESDVRAAVDDEGRTKKLQILMYKLQEPFRRQSGIKPASLAIVLVRFREIEPTNEQNDKLQSILREVSPALREAAQKMDRAGMKKVEDDFRVRALELLTEAQRAKYLEIEKAEDAK
ncbi:MAG: hypothetical protein HOP29_01645 [Phycisphaerales bacterium]|nr:hypothetical protein [Phycisphaerales bacterium]